MNQKPEPWRGYADMRPNARISRLREKVRHAEERGDAAYAMALTSAVALFEAGDGDTGVQQAAHQLHGAVRSWQRS